MALRDLGVSAVIACSPEYRARVEAAGVAYCPLRPGFDDIQRELGMDRAQLTRAVVKHSRFLFRELVLPYLGAGYEDMMKATEDADLILSSGLAFAARLAAERRGIPWIAVVLQPMMFFSSFDPPVIPKAEAFSALLRSMGLEQAVIIGEALSAEDGAAGAARIVLDRLEGGLGKTLKPAEA